ncbi:hypothetical protein EKG38_05565 [Shewanella canadensis]|uniref:Uncharacterized protein n=1 Tax=Shewanella canadensis TaxID=271096 RepID=A0A431WXP0_9GAMM|nr:hypothetical protein [Shewanella canadensis]RTR40188.1 hypothetical protein EKG38_05565 [Shewanella canadensis]
MKQRPFVGEIESLDNRRDKIFGVSEIEGFDFRDEIAERPGMGLQRTERLLARKPAASDR